MECDELELISFLSEAAAAAPEIWQAPSRGLPLSKFILRHQVAGAAPAGRRPTLEIGEQYIYSGRHARSFRAWRFAPGRISAKVSGTTFFYFRRYFRAPSAGAFRVLDTGNNTSWSILDPQSRPLVSRAAPAIPQKLLGREFRLPFLGLVKWHRRRAKCVLYPTPRSRCVL